MKKFFVLFVVCFCVATALFAFTQQVANAPALVDNVADDYSILYTSSNGNIVTPIRTNVFGANIVSNTYENGQGVIMFDGPVTSIGDWAFNGCMTLKSIIIPNSVMTIGESAFSVCNNLTAITIGKGVTSIDARAFQPVRLTSIVVDAENPTYDSRDNCNAIIETATNTLIQGCQKTVIPQSVTHIGEWAFEFCEYLSSITIPNSVISIGEYAFNNCKSLTSVTIPNSITSIGLAAFSSCDKLTSMVVDTANPVYDSRENCNAIIETSTNTLIAGCSNTIIPQSIIRIGEQSFQNCNISSITIPNSVTTIGKDAFAYSDIASITIPNSVTTIGEYAFNTCSSLTSVTIPNSVKDIKRWVFANCHSLNSITLHDGITTIGEGAFINCSSLTSVIIPNSVTSIRTGAFSSCKSLTSIVVDSGNTTYDSRENCNAIIETATNTLIAGCQNTIIPNGITKIYLEAFRGCSSLTAITIPNSVTSVGGWAFNGCSLLDTIYVEATTPPTLEYNDVFTGTPSPTCIVPCGTLAAYQASDWVNQVGELVEEECEETIPDSTYYIYYTSTDGNIVTPYATDVFGANIVSNTYENGQGVITFDGPVTSIGDRAFIETKNLKTMKLPNSVTIIGENAFYECESLTSIIIPNSVKDIDAYAFGNCSSLSSLTMPTNITAIKRSVFDGCSSLTLIEIPHSVTSIESWAFANCSKIESIRIYNGLTSIGDNAFRYCSALKSITIPNSVVKIEHSLFFGCTSLSSIAVETGNQIYDSRNNCNAIIETSTNTLIAGCKATIIPNDIVSIGEDAFVYCHSLSSIEIPNGVINIGEDAFCNCGLKSIFIPSSVRNIEGNTFVYCDYLSSIVVDADNKVYDSRNNCNAIMETSTNRLIVGCKNTVIPSNTKIIGSMAFQTGGILYDTIVIPDGVTSIEDQAFYLCEKLSKVYLPASLSFIGKNVFAGCDSLKVVHVNATIPPTLGENVFKYSSPTCIVPCGTLAAYQASEWANQVGELVEEECEEIVPDSTYYIYYTSTDGNIVTPYATDVFGANIISNTYENGQGVITFDGPITTIGEWAFCNCPLKTIILPNTLESIGSNAFRYTSLQSIIIPKNVVGIDNSLFFGCTSLKSIIVDGENPIYDSRGDCNAIIETATNTLIAGCRNSMIPNSVVSIGDAAFVYCHSLTSISIPNSVVHIGDGAFCNCGISSITIPNSVNEIEGNAFVYCDHLSSITVDVNNTTYDSRNNCNAIMETETNTLVTGCKNTVIPNDTKIIGEMAFQTGGILTDTLMIPNGVTSIERQAFYLCEKLEYVRIPNSVTHIEDFAFSACSSLTSIYLEATIPPTLSDNVFYNTTPPTCIVPCGTLAAYQASDWANQVGELVEEECEETKEITVKARVPASWTDSIFVWVWPTGGEGVELIPEKQDDWYVFTQKGEELNIIFKNGRGWIGYPYQTEDITLTESACLQIYTDNNEYLKATYTFIDCNSVNPNHQILYTTNDSSTIVRSVSYATFGANIISNTYENGQGVITFDGPVTTIGESAFSGCSNLTNIIIPNSVTSIGYAAFADCFSLTSITIPNSVTNIGPYAFSTCTSLTSLTIPNSVTYIGICAFDHCTDLISVTIPNSVTGIGHAAFSGCSSLCSIIIPNSVTSIASSAFSGCSSLTSMVVDSGNTIYDSRENCNAIIETVTNTLIAGCQNTIIPNSVTSIGKEAFEACSSLVSITIPNSVTSIEDYAFRFCSSLTSLTIPNSVTSIGKEAFFRCGSLDTIYIKVTNPPTLGTDVFYAISPTCYIPCGTLAAYQASDWANQVGDLVEECEDLIPTNQIQYTTWDDEIVRIDTTYHIDYNYGVVNYYSMFGANIISNTYENGVGTITFDAPVTTIGSRVFNHSNLRTIILPNNITAIHDDAFADCGSLQSITLPRNLKSIGYGAFRMCSHLQSIEFPEGLESIEGRAFENCFNGMGYYATGGSYIEPNGGYIGSGLSISIPSSVTSIGEGVFAWCSGITSIVVDGNNTTYDSRENCNAIIETATNTMIAGCRNSFIPATVTALGYGVFYGHSIKSINIPDGVVSIGESAFAYSDIETLHVPGSVKTIGRDAFDHCDDLTTLTLSEGLETIEYAGIHCCYALKSIVFPSTLNSIGAYGVSSCTSMTSVEFLSTTPPTIDNNFYGCFWRTPCEFTVPCGTKDAYYTALNADAPSGYHIEPIRIREKGSYVYSITSSNEAQGSVTITDEATCDDFTISFRADATNGYRFVRWSDGNTENPRTLLLTQDTYLTAEFETSVCNVNVWCDTTRGFVIGNGAYSYGTTVTLSAHANEGYRFARWSDNVTENPRTITLYHDMTLRADFMEYSETDLTICESELPHLWYDQSLTATGKYTYTEQYADTYIDSVQHILNLTVNPTVYVEEHITACDSYTWNGETYTTSGEYIYTTIAANGCDSIVTLHLTINETKQAEETITACDNYTWNGETYTTSGEYVYTTIAANGCDSIVTLHLTINNTQYAEESVVACDSYTWNGETYTASGEYVYTTTTNGCDSIVTLHLTINQTQYVEETVIACDSYTWNGETYTQSGEYVYTTNDANGCDSIVTLHLTINNTQYAEESVVACDSYTWNGETYTQSGEYVYTTTAANGCDSIVTLHLTINNTQYAEESIVACDSYTWNGETYTESGEYVYTTTATNGCDSIVTLHLTINATQYAEESIVACDSYTWNGETYTTSGEYVYTTTATNGCDSIVTLHLTINNTQYAEESVVACDSYTWNGETYTESGEYVYTTTAANGCDSIVALHLTINNTQYAEESVVACDSYTWNGETYTQSGEYVYTTTAANGCDSIVTLHLTINNTQYAEESVVACDSYTWNGETYTQSGEYVYTTTAANGCDSIITLHLTINNSEIGETEYATICHGETYIWNGVAYAESGEYSVTLSNTLGCDSIATLHLTIMPAAITTTETVVVGNDELPYVWRGNTYSATGQYTDVEQYTHVACDSAIHVLDLTVLTTGALDEQSVTICETEAPYIWYGKSYSTTGKYTYTEQYVGTDIDSIQHILNLTVNPTVYVEEYITACNNYTWNGETYTASGEYVYTTTATNGCDSIVTLHLTINNTQYAEESVVACDSYTWNGETYTASGEYVYTTTATNGCDSIVTLHLTINNTQYAEESVVACDSYTWNGETYTESGEYVYTTTAANGCDSIVALHLTINNTQYAEESVVACDSYTWNGETYTQSGEYVYTTTAANGCDSIVTLHLTINNTQYAEESVVACDSYTWNGETYTQSGEYVYTTTAANGCDSIITLHLTINNSEIGETEYATICHGETYIWNGVAYAESGEYSVTLSNTLGCDSIATLHLTIMPAAITTTETVVVGNDELPYVWRGNTYSATGQYTDVEQYTHVACDSAIHVLDLTVLTTGALDEQSVTICETEAPYIWYGKSYSTTGKYTYTEQYVGTDIDSIQHILNLTVNPTVYVEEYITACNNYTWNGETYTASGEYVYTTTATNGCDSIVTLHLTINNTQYAEESVVACDSYTWNGETYTASGEYVYITTAANGCDSIVTLHLTINNSEVAATEYATICHGETYIWNGVAYAESGEYSVTLSNTLGCDSIVTLHLTIMPAAITTTETVVVGNDELPYVWRGNTYSATGRYTDVEQYDAVACDSAIYVLDLTVLNTDNYDELSVTICETETPYIWYGESYSTTGKYTYTEQYVGTDIDSIQHILNLIVNPTVYVEEYITACNNYTWNGETYTASGEYVYTTTATNGCDSIVTLHLTINNTQYAEESVVACDSYTWNGETYTASGEYVYITTAANGCDSIVTLHLTINKSEYVEETVTACDSYEWNGVVYTESGDYTYITTTDQGCERVEVLHLIILPEATTESEELALCPSELPYEWYGQWLTEAGSYTIAEQYAGMECDSIIHELTVNVYSQTLPAVVTLPIVRTGEAINVTIPTAEIQAHIAAETWYAPNAEVAWYIMENGDWAALTAEPVKAGTKQVVLKYAIETDCGNVESDNMVIDIIPTSVENSNSQSPIFNCQKVLYEDHIYILREGRVYTIMGAEVK